MKVLIISQYFWPEAFRINDLALGLRDRGHQVTVLTGKPNYPAGKFFPGYGFFRRSRDDFHGIPLIRVPLIPRGAGGSVGLALNFFSFAFFASLLAPFRCHGAFDAIFVYEPSPITVAFPGIVLRWLKRAPLLLWVQDLWPESLSATNAVHKRSILRLVESMVRFIYRRCDRILVQSRAFSHSIVALGADRSRILYFPNSAESIYRPVEAAPQDRQRLKLPSGFRVMFAGNIGAAQDFATIIKAAELLRNIADIHWVILGEGRMRGWVMDQVETQRLSSTFHLLGGHPVESMPVYFAHANAMLVTLKKDPIFALTIPAKIQSYLACGKPIIAALDGEGAAVVTEAGAGIAVGAENPRALADAVLRLYGMSDAEREAVGARGRQYFEQHFEREMLLTRLESWMHDLKAAA